MTLIAGGRSGRRTDESRPAFFNPEVAWIGEFIRLQSPGFGGQEFAAGYDFRRRQVSVFCEGGQLCTGS